MSKSSLSIGEKKPLTRIEYSEIPTEAAWKLQTGQDMTRVADETLTLVDLALANHEAAKGNFDLKLPQTRYPYLRSLINVYAMSSRWIREKIRAKQMEVPSVAQIKPYMVGLSWVSADKLAELLGCTPDMVDITLMKLQTIEMKKHGKEVDQNMYSDKKLIYLTDAEVMQLRVQFKGKLAYQFPVYDMSKKMDTLELMDTRTWKKHTAYTGMETNGKLGVAGFALTFNRNLYAGMHNVDEKPSWIQRLIGDPKARAGTQKKAQAFYHSSYICGEPVLCTGCLTVVKGEVTYVNNFSGHYQPKPEQLVHVLDTLAMNGADLGKVQVEYLTGINTAGMSKKGPMSAKTFLQTFGKG